MRAPPGGWGCAWPQADRAPPILFLRIADAYMDSIPLVAITGQVYSKYIGKMAFQETDFFGLTLPIVKHSYLGAQRP